MNREQYVDHVNEILDEQERQEAAAVEKLQEARRLLAQAKSLVDEASGLGEMPASRRAQYERCLKTIAEIDARAVVEQEILRTRVERRGELTAAKPAEENKARAARSARA